jgi:hypothetical protein
MNACGSFVVAALLGTLACGGSPPTESTPSTAVPSVDRPNALPFLFHLREDYETLDYALWTFRSDAATGVLAVVSETPLGRGAGPYALHPTLPVVYVFARAPYGSPSPDALHAYHVDVEGRLTRVSTLTLPDTPGFEVSFSFDPGGQHLYVAGSRRVALCGLRADGVPELAASDVFAGLVVGGVATSPRHLYAITRGLNVLRVDAATGLPAGQPQQVIVGDFLSSALSATPPWVRDGLIVAHAVTGTRGPQGSQLGIQPYHIDRTTGLLKSIPGGPFFNTVPLAGYRGAIAATTAPRAVAVHPTGRFVFVNESVEVSYRTPSHIHTDTDASLLTTYRYDPRTGTFSPAAAPIAQDVPDGFFAQTLELSADGSFLYTGASGWGPYAHLLGYRIDAETGALTPLPGPAFTFPREGYY